MAELAQRASTLRTWQTARVEALEPLTARIRRVVLRPQVWHAPWAGQHLDLRLTADDGYQAQRSYSLLSPPELEGVYELGIERLADEARLAAVSRERLRIARDLHDSVAHHISLIGVQTAAARRAMDTKPELAAEAMRGVEDMSRDAVAELRSMLHRDE